VSQRDESQSHPIQGLATAVVLVSILWLAFSFTSVDANSQEVRTSFGKPTGVIGNGPHLVAPWSTGTSFSSARQFIVFKDKPGENEQPRVATRLAGQATADVEGVVSYTQPSGKVIELFRSWKTEDRIRNLFVFQEAKGAMWTDIFAKMNPVPANLSISGICANTIGAVR